MREKYENITDWIVFVVNILLYCHLMSILYHSCAMIDSKVFGSTETWLHQYDKYGGTKYERYMSSLVVSSQSMVTSNVFIPQTSLE